MVSREIKSSFFSSSSNVNKIISDSKSDSATQKGSGPRLRFKITKLPHAFLIMQTEQFSLPENGPVMLVTECRCWWHLFYATKRWAVTKIVTVILKLSSTTSMSPFRQQHWCYRNVIDRDVKIISFHWNIMVTLNVHIEGP